MFALAVFDRKLKKITIARDKLRETTLLWLAEEHFMFASELRL